MSADTSCSTCLHKQRHIGVTLEAIRTGSLKNCIHCQIREQVIAQCIPPELVCDKGRLHWSRAGPWHGLRWEAWNGSSITFSIYRRPETKAEGGTSSLIPVSYYRSSTASNESLFLAQQWIRQCYESHAQCGSKSLSALPKRVLQIANTTIKLYESKGEKAKYTCLSHCWGTSAPTHMTTKDTVHHYSSGAGIPIDSIPQTFRDAIDFSRRLGIEFIWIDSLCIIQDDLQDWEEQASQMASIYKEAHLTLCATSAPDSSWGCYSSCTQNMKPFSLFIGGNASTGFFCSIEDQSIHIPDWDRATLPFYRNDFPLLTRAWCYQERLLSPRLLHFTRGELMWECAGASACECTSLEFLGTNKRLDSKYLPEQREKLAYVTGLERLRAVQSIVTSAGSLSLSQVHDIARHWHDIVEEYVNLELTFHSDRLVALSGIAQEVLRLRPGGEVYLAGLWRTTLLEDLRWTVSHGNCIRPSAWRAPSWSWASLNGPIFYLDRDDTDIRDYAEVIDVKTSSEENRPLGQVTFGFVELNAPTVAGRLWVPESRSGIKRQMFFEADGVRVEFQADCQSDIHRSKTKGVSDEELLCLRLGNGLNGKDCCLVLRKQLGFIAGYERIGCLQLDTQQAETTWFPLNGSLNRVGIV